MKSLMICVVLIAAASLAAAAPAAPNVTKPAASPVAKAAAGSPAIVAKGVGKVGEPCARGESCISGICNGSRCISRQAACALSAAAPASNCIGNTSEPFVKLICNDFTDALATKLNLAAGLGSVINSTECYSNGLASCVVLQDSASLVHYGSMCPPASGSGAAAARTGVAALVAAAAAALFALL